MLLGKVIDWLRSEFSLPIDHETPLHSSTKPKTLLALAPLAACYFFKFNFELEFINSKNTVKESPRAAMISIS